MKYAFENKKVGLIHISFYKNESGQFKIQLKDDGIGKNVSISDGFGTQLVKLLTRQIEGTFTERPSVGYSCEIVF